MKKLKSFFFFSFFLIAPVSAQQLDPFFWITNGPVNCIEGSGNFIYAGGNFSDVGPCTGHGVFIDSSTAQVLPPFLKLNGSVYCAASDLNGGFYIGGLFIYKNVKNLAHVLSNGTIDTAWAPQPDDAVRCIAFCSCWLFVGGDFMNIGNDSRSHIAAIGLFTGTADANWQPDANGTVNAILVDEQLSCLYVGGIFTTIAAHPRTYLARLDMNSGGVFSTFDFDYPMDGQVKCLKKMNDTTLFIGGSFSSFDNGQRKKFAAMGLSTYHLLPLNLAFN